MGLDTLWQHKLRSLLTILGVVIGTMTVIVIAAFVSGIDARVSKEIESFGTNSLYISFFSVSPCLRASVVKFLVSVWPGVLWLPAGYA